MHDTMPLNIIDAILGNISAEILNVLHVANIIIKHIMIIPPGVLTFRITFSLS